MKYSKQNRFLLANMFLVLLFFVFVGKNLNAQQIPREELVAAYIFSFAQNIEWRDEENIDKFRFAIITQNKSMVEELHELTLKKKIRNKSATVVSEERLTHTEGIQLVFVAKDKEELIPEIFDKIEGRNILLVSEGYANKKIVMINLFETKDQTIQFEINKANIINQDLIVLPDMVLLGGTEIDVAKLYKESQDTLRFKEDQITDMQQHLDSLSYKIETSNKEIAEQQLLIKQQKQKILQHQKKIENQQDELQRLADVLDNNKQLLAQQEQDARLQQNELNEQQDELLRLSELLNSSKKLLDEQQIEIDRGKAVLSEQQSEIDSQNNAILLQKKALDRQGSTIEAQKNVVYLLIVIAVLAFGLSFTIFRAYKNKQHANQDLNAQKDKLQEVASALEAANKELEAFAYSVSHDLRTPLNHIDGFLELLQKRAQTVLDERSRHYMDTISNSAKHMGSMIDDLLAFSRMGRQALLLRSVDLNNLVSHVLQDLELEIAGRNIEWRIGHLPVVGGDRAMLRMVLVNLIANAVKFTRPREQAVIEIDRLHSPETETVIFVRDNGVGFDMAYSEKLFGVFQRLHNSAEFEGTGIGLANVRRIITRHGGRTWAEGNVDRGATFFFSLPQHIQDAKP